MKGDLAGWKPGCPATGEPTWGEVGVVVLRCIGCAMPGAVRVEGGAEKVMLPRLPIELLPPARANARPGASARDTAATPARRRLVRRMALRFVVDTRGIWGGAAILDRGSGAGHRHPFDSDRWRIGASSKHKIVRRRQVREH